MRFKCQIKEADIKNILFLSFNKTLFIVEVKFKVPFLKEKEFIKE